MTIAKKEETGNKIILNCDNCKTEFKRWISKEKRDRKNHFCSKNCYNLFFNRKTKKIRIFISKNVKKTILEKRHKSCKCCGIKYCDVSIRSVGKTCSKKCASSLSAQTRKKKGSYDRTKKQNEELSKTLKMKYESGEIKQTEEQVGKRIQTSIKNWGVPYPTQSREVQKIREENCLKKYGETHHMKIKKYKDLFSKIFTGRSFSIETRKKMSQSSRKRMKNQGLYSNADGGKRKDLNCYFRSRWEANYARMLNFLNISWEFEPRFFDIAETETYTPDFFIENYNIFVEIKGIMNENTMRKFNMFVQKFPDIQIIFIGLKEYRNIDYSFKNIIPNWEKS